MLSAPDRGGRGSGASRPCPCVDYSGAWRRSLAGHGTCDGGGFMRRSRLGRHAGAHLVPRGRLRRSHVVRRAQGMPACCIPRFGLAASFLRRRCRGLIGLALLGALAAACTSQAAGTQVTPTTTLPVPTTLPSTAEPTQTQAPISPLQGSVSIWTAWEADHVAAVSDLLESFRQQHPRVQVRLSYYRPSELEEAFKTAAAAGRGPTILLGSLGLGARAVARRPDPRRCAALAAGAARHHPGVGVEPGLQRRRAGGPAGAPPRRRPVSQPRAGRTAGCLAGRSPGASRRRLPPTLRPSRYSIWGSQFSGAQLTACGGTLLRAGGGLGFDQQTGECWLESARSIPPGRPAGVQFPCRSGYIPGRTLAVVDRYHRCSARDRAGARGGERQHRCLAADSGG